ncbi:MAG: helix-turn-helix transcriptional regulator [Clostridia bacterium]|nr:helix-turn-helix transcriptional regulator [Clostridia bacterium]
MAKSLAITEKCPMEVGLNILSGKWKLRILWHLSKGAIRFNELQRQLGKITTKTLTQQLRELENQHIIKRVVYPETPPKVEYSLTELGQSISPVLKALCEWGTLYQNKL